MAVDKDTTAREFPCLGKPESKICNRSHVGVGQGTKSMTKSKVIDQPLFPGRVTHQKLANLLSILPLPFRSELPAFPPLHFSPFGTTSFQIGSKAKHWTVSKTCSPPTANFATGLHEPHVRRQRPRGALWVTLPSVLVAIRPKPAENTADLDTEVIGRKGSHNSRNHSGCPSAPMKPTF